MNHLDPRTAEYFLAVAEELHFTRAAARLYISQPSLSAAIRRLEARLGTELFERSTRQVTLTAAGRALIPGARAVLASATGAIAATRAAADAAEQLTIGVTRSAHPFGRAVVHALQDRIAGVRIDVVHDFAPGLERRLLAHELDLVVAFCPARLPALRYERLADLPAVCAVDARHPLAGRSQIELAELADQIFVLAPDSIGPGLSAATLSMCARAGFRPRTAYSVGYLPPPNLDPREMVGIAADIALDGVPQPHAIRTIPLVGHTLPVELIRRAGPQPTAIRTAIAIARDLHQGLVRR